MSRSSSSSAARAAVPSTTSPRTRTTRRRSRRSIEQRGFDDERTFRKWLSGYPKDHAPWFADPDDLKWMDAGFETAAEYDMQRALFSQRPDWEWQTLGFKSKKLYDTFVQQFKPL